jgi:photosynthetic reaction center cytochrome c subunit
VTQISRNFHDSFGNGDPPGSLYFLRMKTGVLLTIALLFWTHPRNAEAQPPTPTVVEGPNVKVLTGLFAQQFQEEMNFMVQALGVSCNTCHVRGNFASEDNEKKLIARRMLEMTKAINQQFFPDYKPKEGESVLGKVTCYTCHKGESMPKHTIGY